MNKKMGRMGRKFQRMGMGQGMNPGRMHGGEDVGDTDDANPKKKKGMSQGMNQGMSPGRMHGDPDIDDTDDATPKGKGMGMGMKKHHKHHKDQSSSQENHMGKGMGMGMMGGKGGKGEGREEQVNEAKWVRSLGHNVVTSLANQTTTSLTVDSSGSRHDSDNFSVIVSFLSYGSSGAASCADSLGNTYSVAAHVAFNTNYFLTVFYVTGISSLIKNTVITVTHPNSTRRIVVADEFKGLETSAAADQLAQAAASSSATFVTSGLTSVTAQKNELLYGAFGVNGPITDSFKKEHKWDLLQDRGTLASDGNDIRLITSFRTVDKTDTYEASGNLGTARIWAAVTQTFKSSGGGSDITEDIHDTDDSTPKGKGMGMGVR